MKATKEIDVIPHTNSGIVREVIEAMFYNSVFINEDKPTDWDYEYFNLDSLYSFNPNFI